MMEYLTLLTPELFLLVMTSMILLVSSTLPKDQEKTIQWATIFVLLVATFLYVKSGLDLGHQAAGNGRTKSLFDGMLFIDPLTQLIKAFLCLLTLLAFLIAKPYLESRQLYNGAFYALVLFALLGQAVLVSSKHLLTLYLGLELMSLASYAMVAMQRNSPIATEASIKYFILGAIASGLIIYGMSLLYGATGTLQIDKMIAYTNVNTNSELVILVLATALIFSGIAFKIGLAPFHVWVADVYQGAPSGVTMMIATMPKVALLIFAFRMLLDVMAFFGIYGIVFLVFSVLSMLIANIAALAQTSIKRMLAYSSIANMGFMFLGMSALMFSAGAQFQNAAMTTPKTQGLSQAAQIGRLIESIKPIYSQQVGMTLSIVLLFVLAYALSTLVTFGVVAILSTNDEEADRYDDFKGLWLRRPKLAISMAIAMFSLAGMPLFIGFYAKLVVLQLIVAYANWYIPILAVLAFAVAAFYYIRVVKYMFFDSPPELRRHTKWLLAGKYPTVKTALAENVLFVLALCLIVLGIMPKYFQEIIVAFVKVSVG